MWFILELPNTKGETKMKRNLKKNLGNFAINMGKHAVGKCMIPGMFDPKIPNALKAETKKETKRTL